MHSVRPHHVKLIQMRQRAKEGCVCVCVFGKMGDEREWKHLFATMRFALSLPFSFTGHGHCQNEWQIFAKNYSFIRRDCLRLLLLNIS